MSTFRADVRAAAAAMLREYAGMVGVKLQVYEGRPWSLAPPTAFIDTIREVQNFDAQRERVVQIDIKIVHGLFDSRDAADQGDQFVDGFVDWSWEHFHAAGADTSLAPVSTTDDPAFEPEWVPEDRRRTYYATTVTLEGRTFAL